MFDILLVADKVGPARPDVRIAYPATLELEAEIRINREEICIEPPREKVWIIPRDAAMSARTGCPRELYPSLEGGCGRDGGKPGIPTQTRRQGRTRSQLQCDRRHLA